MPLSPEQWKQMERLFNTTPTVDIKIDIRGTLSVDGQPIILNIEKKLGPEALKLEVAMVRAITKAEDRMRERIASELGKIGIRIPNV